jgi:hypothetical protein
MSAVVSGRSACWKDESLHSKGTVAYRSSVYLCLTQVLKYRHNVVWAAQQAADGIDVDP